LSFIPAKKIPRIVIESKGSVKKCGQLLITTPVPLLFIDFVSIVVVFFGAAPTTSEPSMNMPCDKCNYGVVACCMGVKLTWLVPPTSARWRMQPEPASSFRTHLANNPLCSVELPLDPPGNHYESGELVQEPWKVH
jgi:hypothetical protein